MSLEALTSLVYITFTTLRSVYLLNSYHSDHRTHLPLHLRCFECQWKLRIVKGDEEAAQCVVMWMQLLKIALRFNAQLKDVVS